MPASSCRLHSLVCQYQPDHRLRISTMVSQAYTSIGSPRLKAAVSSAHCAVSVPSSTASKIYTVEVESLLIITTPAGHRATHKSPFWSSFRRRKDIGILVELLQSTVATFTSGVHAKIWCCRLDAARAIALTHVTRNIVVTSTNHTRFGDVNAQSRRHRIRQNTWPWHPRCSSARSPRRCPGRQRPLLPSLLCRPGRSA